MRTLFLIPARGGSKGIPGKNIKLLDGKSLICYSIDNARAFAKDADICVSTDSEEIINLVNNYNLKIPFKRPDYLSTDSASSYDVIIHALKFYENVGIKYDNIVLLQPTSPFRKSDHIKDALSLFSLDLDMVVSVKESKANPYFSLFEENRDGYLTKSKTGNFSCRQDCPAVYQYNGAIYIINTLSVKKMQLAEFKKIKKYVMDDFSSVDIDIPVDWEFCEFLLNKGYVKL